MIKIARDVNKAVEEVKTIPTLGFIIDKVGVEIADPDPVKISVVIYKTLFLSKLLYFFLYFSVSALRLFNIFSWSGFSVSILVLLIDNALFLFSTILHLHLFWDRPFISQKKVLLTNLKQQSLQGCVIVVIFLEQDF